MRMAILFVTRNLSVARMLYGRTVVMRAGRIAEQRPTDTLFDRRRHADRRALLHAIPLPGIDLGWPALAEPAMPGTS